MAAERKPSIAELGLDLDALAWQRAGAGRADAAPAARAAAGAGDDAPADGVIEVAFATVADQTWVLMRVAGDPAGRVLVYDRHEWECFVDGAKNGEFDDAAD